MIVNGLQECKRGCVTFPYIFGVEKICGHRCGCNQFWCSPFFLLHVDGLLLSMASFLISCSLKSVTFCWFLNLPIGRFSLNRMDDVAWLLFSFYFYKIYFHKLHHFSFEFKNEVVMNLCHSLSIILHKDLKQNF
jgi:hypothetical protein